MPIEYTFPGTVTVADLVVMAYTLATAVFLVRKSWRKRAGLSQAPQVVIATACIAAAGLLLITSVDPRVAVGVAMAGILYEGTMKSRVDGWSEDDS